MLIADMEPNQTMVRALHPKILVVLKRRFADGWCVYIGPVPGHNHEQEYGEVLRTGNKMCESDAKAMFPHMDPTGCKYAK